MSAIIQYKASDMILYIDSDASYLSEQRARNRTGGKYYLSSLRTDPKKLQTSRHQKMAQSTRNVESSNIWWRPRPDQKLGDCSTMGKHWQPYASHSMNSILPNHQSQSKQKTPHLKALSQIRFDRKGPRQCKSNFIERRTGLKKKTF